MLYCIFLNSCNITHWIYFSFCLSIFFHIFKKYFLYRLWMPHENLEPWLFLLLVLILIIKCFHLWTLTLYENIYIIDNSDLILNKCFCWLTYSRVLFHQLHILPKSHLTRVHFRNLGKELLSSNGLALFCNTDKLSFTRWLLETKDIRFIIDSALIILSTL